MTTPYYHPYHTNTPSKERVSVALFAAMHASLLIVHLQLLRAAAAVARTRDDPARRRLTTRRAADETGNARPPAQLMIISPAANQSSRDARDRVLRRFLSSLPPLSVLLDLLDFLSRALTVDDLDDDTAFFFLLLAVLPSVSPALVPCTDDDDDTTPPLSNASTSAAILAHLGAFSIIADIASTFFLVAPIRSFTCANDGNDDDSDDDDDDAFDVVDRGAALVIKVAAVVAREAAIKPT